MENNNTSGEGSSKMAFTIDLNESPIPSPRELLEDAATAAMGSPKASVCSVCRKGIPVGKVPGNAEESREEKKCFRCVLKNNDGGGGGGLGRFDINAAPPCEQEEGDCVALVSVRDGNGGSKIQSSTPLFSSHSIAARQLNPGPEDIVPSRQRTPYVATETFNSGFRVTLQQKLQSEGLHPVGKGSTVGVRVHSGLSAPLQYSPESPNSLYLESLREYIAERAGVLGEGWNVVFEFCDRRYKTSAVYIAPDGSRLKSMEDVARHIGLMSRHHHTDTEKGSSDNAFTQSVLKLNPGKKESPVFLTSQNSRQRQMVSRASNNDGFLSTSGITYNKSTKEHVFSDNGSHRDGICDGFPIQFQDFCLISPGNIDSRPSYHNTNQIWPVGYRCCWHDRVTGSLFVCDVADGGDCGPIFKVQRYPCTMHCMPVSSTILSRAKQGSCKGDGKVGNDYFATFQAVDDDNISTITLLNEEKPPSLDNYLYTSNRGDGIHNSRDNSSNLDLESLHQRCGKSLVDGLGLYDIIGEFQVQSRSIVFVWEMVSHALLYAYHQTYKQKGAVKFFCDHDVCEADNGNLDNIDSLSRFYFSGLSIPRVAQHENEFKIACEKLLEWLNQDRFGLDADFVQEIIEQLPGVATCVEYKDLNNRRHSSALRTVGSGFLQAERKTNGTYGTSKGYGLKLGETGDPLKRALCPSGKPLNSKLPSYLIGDALQVWELAWRFADILGLGQSFSFQELELELVSPWIDSYPLDSRSDTGDGSSTGDYKSPAGAASLGKCAGSLCVKILFSLLRLLVCELLSKAAAYVCPNFDTGESKSRRGRKKDFDFQAALKKMKLDMLPVNELTWHEIGRRYILAVISMEGNLESTEIATRESGKVFHCLRGDGGILCGSLVGIAALERDAMILADATKQIFGALKNQNEIVSLCGSESNANGAQTVEVKNGSIPEWAETLLPVRSLPTNVGARIKRLVVSALDQGPPEWAKKTLEHSISKQVYKGNASGPTKRAVVSVLNMLSGDNSQQKVEKKEKVKIKTTLADVITKQCRIVLRKTAASDKDRVFCNLLARTMLNPNDNYEEGLLGYPAMVSRPLDFRTIDLRLAAGVYESHEAFIDDVREVWHNIRTAYGDRSDLVDVVADLSKTFEDLYEKEVLALVHKISEISNTNDSSSDAIKARDDLLVHVCTSPLPRAPWDEGICKVCGMDKDDDNVLLCDKCDSEYHRYCLNPPLLRIPEGNWYCPSCASGQNAVPVTVYGTTANQCRKKSQGEFTCKFLEELAQLENLMEMKEYWEFSVEERILFMKFLFDEALNSATVREHMEQCANRVADLQHKLRSLTSELRLLKVKEEMLVSGKEKVTSGIHSGRGDLNSDASSSLLAVEDSSRGKLSERGNHLSASSGSSQLEHGSSLYEQIGYSKQPDWLPSGSNKSTSSTDTLGPGQCQHLLGDYEQHENNITPAPQLRGLSLKTELPITTLFPSSQVMPVKEKIPTAPATSIHESHGRPSFDQIVLLSSQENSIKIGTIKNDIINLQETIASVEVELFKASLRKDFLGRDSNGRVYWAFHSAGARPWIIASGDLTSKNRCPEEFMSIPGFNKWVYYESDDEIEELVGWLREDTRERELRDSILQLQINKLKDSNYPEKHMLGKGDLGHNKNKGSFADLLRTSAIAVLEKRYGPCLGAQRVDICLDSRASKDSKMYRCECLELVWSSKDHCSLCHWSFSSNEDLKQHLKENCKPASVVKRSLLTEDVVSRCKKRRNATSQEKECATVGNLQVLAIENQTDGPISVERSHKDCPFNFEEIMTRFIVPGTVKDEVNKIGLVRNGGLPSFLPVVTPYLSDPTLALSSSRINESSSKNQLSYPNKEARALFGVKENNEATRLLLEYGENGLSKGSSERLKPVLMSGINPVSSVKKKGLAFGVSKEIIIRESSSRSLVGRASEFLKFLKINLLDMDAALPEDALRTSRSNQDKRCTWRAFVKSAKSIYEMVQALVIFEDTIRSDYLRNDWWYWSSPSTAMKMTTLSALALRIYSLDSAIFYEKPLPSSAETVDPNCAVDDEATPKNLANLSSPSPQKTPETDVSETPSTTGSRASKRRKDLNS